MPASKTLPVLCALLVALGLGSCANVGPAPVEAYVIQAEDDYVPCVIAPHGIERVGSHLVARCTGEVK